MNVGLQTSTGNGQIPVDPNVVANSGHPNPLFGLLPEFRMIDPADSGGRPARFARASGATLEARSAL
jgi:hypothetical protein